MTEFIVGFLGFYMNGYKILTSIKWKIIGEFIAFYLFVISIFYIVEKIYYWNIQ
ncbi:MAG: hypothetical protein HQ538_04485 [Parcubacteria group bacterium]|nr:hypothetical protein [Parcubacteria group bacterium]